MKNYLDIKTYTNRGLKQSVSYFLNSLEVPKYMKYCLSDWSHPEMSDGQIMYASLDAIYGQFLLAKCIEEFGTLKEFEKEIKKLIKFKRSAKAKGMIVEKKPARKKRRNFKRKKIVKKN